MIPGPDQIIACPKCKGLAKHMTLASGNGFGAKIWTDGKGDAPMCPGLPPVVKCHHCAEIYWLEDAEKVGSIDTYRWRLGDGDQDDDSQVNPDWAAAERIQVPTEDDYYHALEKGLAKTLEQEKELRILAWWRRNDDDREGYYDDYRDDYPDDYDVIGRSLAGETPISLGPLRQNLIALTHLLEDESGNDCLMKAEVLRELGEFEAARLVLRRINTPNAAVFVSRIMSLCDIEDTCVREVKIDKC